MSKIVLTDTAGGFNISVINDNFDEVADTLQNKVLYRDNPTGEPNNMESDLDMDGNRVYNLPIPTLPSEAARLQDIVNSVAGIVPASAIPFTPYLDVFSTNVQAAIQELRDDVGVASNFLATGAGAVQRTRLSKLQETISVVDYGAVCDGVTNDSAAVLLAQTAAGKRALLFPGITHLGTAITITAPIADTGAQIFSATSLVTIANGRDVKAAWFGAKTDGTESSAPIIRALTAAKSLCVLLDSGVYRTDFPIVYKGNVTAGYQKLKGAGVYATYIDYYGTGAGSAIQSDQSALVENTEVSQFSIRRLGAAGTQTALDVGTIRSSRIEHINVSDFHFGLCLSKNVDPIGNYYNHIDNIQLGNATTVGSRGVQLGNDLVGHTNPEGNANTLTNIVTAGFATGLWINGTGNKCTGFTILGATSAINLTNGVDNIIDAYIETQTAQAMGVAGVTAIGNTLNLFNDALNAVRFVDNGRNNILGNIQAGGSGYLHPIRMLDTYIIDHFLISKTAVTFPTFSIKLPDVNGAMRVEVLVAGSTQFTGNWGGSQQWAINKNASATPTITLKDTDGHNRFTTAAIADGTVTWTMLGDAAQPTTCNISVRVHGLASLTNNFGSPIVYQRIP